MYHGERFNGYTHLAGAMLASAGAVALVSLATAKGDPWRIVSFSTYGATLCLVFLISTLYHSTQGPAKLILRKLDYISIYLFIAGSYTPFALVTLSGTDSWMLFGGVWGLAVIGIVQEIWVARGARVSSLVIYLLMGWLALVTLEPLLVALTWKGLGWLLAAGLVYTFGVLFYLFDERFPHWHGIWHVFVLVGSALHFAAVVQFVA